MALRAQTDTNTVIVRDLTTPLSPIDRSSRQNLPTLDQIDMVDIYRVFHPTTISTQHILFS
jgi:hypothetical protein